MTRRTFTGLAAGGTGLALAAAVRGAPVSAPAPQVWVLHGSRPAELMARALEIMQGNGWFGGKKVRRMALKVNAAWARTPEEGANTHPELVQAFIRGVKNRGVESVTLPENPCNNARIAFERSGIGPVAKDLDCEMIDLKNKGPFVSVQIPRGRILKQVEVAEAFLKTDAVVNMPVAKHHKGAVLTLAMKNWMGAIKDRRAWHVQGLPQCIADFASFMEADWTLIDATRCMMDSGPQGPARELKHPELLILSRSQVAADAYASTLFHETPAAVPYLPLAAEMGLGEIDVSKMDVQRIEV
jgi:uncharacterized protein (DUF362 family)